MNEASVQPLLSAITSNSPSSAPKLSWFRRQHVIPTSKGVLMILLWNVVVGATFGVIIITGIAAVLSDLATDYGHTTSLYILLAFYTSIAFIQFLFYPLGGLLADCCGQYKIIALSIFKICCGYGIVLAPIIIFAHYEYDIDKLPSPATRFLVITAIAIAVILYIIGLTGFQANVVQFGLDQLLDSPSEDLSTFLHWFVWTDYVGNLIIRILALLSPCTTDFGKVVVYSPAVFLTVLTASLILSLCKRKWFHCEPHTHSPYGMVYRVLKFTAQHSQPLRRSAFAYCDDEIPSRLDFAKQLYGGPFPTETVENVKTFFRILTMLVLIAPVFNIHIATSYLFPLYGIHIGSNPINTTYGCSAVWMVLQSGNLSYIITVVILPLYIMLVHPHIPRWLPRILHRLFLGVVLIVSVVLLMFGILVAGKHAAIEKNANTTCLFLGEIRSGKHILNDTSSSRLNFYPLTLIVPSFLNGIAVPLIHVAILEFISAQSPHTMKGVLLGAFYAFRGLAIMVGCVLVIPFTQQHWWKHTNGSLYGCGFSYYLVTLLLGLAGIGFVAIGVKWYHYRDRQDRPYDSRYVEEYYNRYTSHSNKTASSPDEQDAPLHPQIDTSILVYGTMDGT